MESVNFDANTTSSGQEAVEDSMDFMDETSPQNEVIVDNSLDDNDHEDIVRELQDIETIKRLAELFKTISVPEVDKKEKMGLHKRQGPVDIVREEYGMNLPTLRSWAAAKTDAYRQSEEGQQEFALSQMKGFMSAIVKLTKIQSWYRMMKAREVFKRWREERNEVRGKYFSAWKICVKAELMRMKNVCGTSFTAWAQEVKEHKRLSSLAVEFFRMSIARSRLTPQAVMVFFSPGSFSEDVSESDIVKIRRLILIRLFRGWLQEVTFEKRMRFKACQILARAFRRYKAPLFPIS